MKITVLRVIHSLFALYFALCLAYTYYAGLTARYDALLAISVISLAIEGYAVFILNKGDCPLIHVQKKLGDNKPFFELFFSPPIASRVIPFFALLTWLAVGLLIIRLVLFLI